MGSSATGICIPQNSKKRVFPGSSSSMESKPEVSNKMLKQNEDAMIMISSGITVALQHQLIDGVCSSKEVKSHIKGKGVIEIDLEDGVSNSYNGKDFIDLTSDDDNVSEDEYADPFKMTPADHAMPSLSLTGTANCEQKEMKTCTRSSSSTCPSLRLQKCVMKVRSINKLVKARYHKMSSVSDVQIGAGTSSLVDFQNVKIHGEIIPMENVKLDQGSGMIQKILNVAGSSSSMGQLDNDNDVLRKYKNFKKFDIVEDFSDHRYSASGSGTMQPPSNWAKKIQEEWRILKKGLPDMIYVRASESRVDLLRAVIMGAEGTPYHDGLFFFDMRFPRSYPHDPPEVHYHSGGLHINPNLYEDGKVCLSLLNTWIGAQNEKWTPGVSTVLQVLVSIQGMILNAKPFFNEPGYADFGGSDYGEYRSMRYNESTLVLSLKTMVYTMKKPPKYFEDLVIGHFHDRARGILTTCKAYTEGVGVGCAVDEVKKTGSGRFKNDVQWYLKTLVGAFKEIGVENVDEFMPPTLTITQKVRAFLGI